MPPRSPAPALVAALILATLAGLASAVAQDAPKTFACRFETGTAGSFDKGAFQDSVPTPLAFEITEIDLEGQSARLTLPGGTLTGSLRVVRALNANHFLEVAQEGFLNLTTVYDRDPVSGAYPAVHSRHFGLIGTPVFAQYHGLCQGK